MVALEPKDPAALVPYAVNWSTYLGTEIIATSEWIAPDGLTISAHTATGTTATVWLEGGTAGRTYRVTNKIATSDNRVDSRSFLIRCQER